MVHQGMNEKLSSTLVKDTEEMVGWRTMGKLQMDEFWMRVAWEIEEEVLDKNKVENSKREAYNSRGAHLAGTKKQEIPNTQMG